MGHLSNKAVGVAARDLADMQDRQLASDYVSRLEQRLERLERALVSMTNIPRGLRVRTSGDDDLYVPFSPEGWVEMWSSDDTIEITNNRPATGYMVDLTYNGSAGCPDVFKTVTPDSGGAITASGCSTDLPVNGESQCGGTHIRTTVNGTAVDIGVAFPDCVETTPNGGDWLWGNPTGWLRIERKSSAACVAVPYWVCADA